MTRLRRLALLCPLAVVAACRMAPYEGRYDFYEGWRKGDVVEVRTFEDVPSIYLPNCDRASLRSTVARNAPWSVIRYYPMSRRSHTSVALDEVPLKVGDRVYVNTSGCPVRVVPRTAD
jgi:hypothetical protein